MNVKLREEPMTALVKLAVIPTAFKVNAFFRITSPNDTPQQAILSERTCDPYIKDYDSIKGEGPTQWSTCFNLSNWGLIIAYSDSRPIGGAAIAFDTPKIVMLEGRRDLAALWDIRVSPEARGLGIGSALFQAVETWAVSKNCRQLKVETQNINVPACKFYMRQGCTLGAIHRFAYPEHPDEIQLLWYKDIGVAKAREEPF